MKYYTFDRFIVALGLFSVLLMLAPSVAAQTTAVKSATTSKPAASPKVFDVKLRLQHPFAAGRIFLGTDENSTGINSETSEQTVVGNSVWFAITLGMDIRRLVTIEIGMDIPFNELLAKQDGSWNLYIRGGVMPTVVDKRGSKPTGRTLQLGGLLGYEFSHIDLDETFIVAGEQQEREINSITLHGAMDYTRWFHRNFGFGVRLLIGAALPFYQVDHLGDANHRNVSFHFALEIGPTF